MFTGLVNQNGQCGAVLAVHQTEHSAQLCIATLFTDIQIGESIAIDGACLTVTKILSAVDNHTPLCFDISPETLSLTTLHDLQKGSKVNMERALRLSDRLGGHFVTGHVDQMCYLASVQKNECVLMRFMGIVPAAIENVVKKGSIAVNGVSLTINEVVKQGADDGFEVMLIPQTLKETNLSELTVGDKVNIEFDMLVKVVNNRLNLEKTVDYPHE